MIYDFLCANDEYVEQVHKININDATTRSIFWYIIYLIISVAEVNTYIIADIFATTKMFFISGVNPEQDDVRANYLTNIAGHSMIIIGSVLMVLYHIGNKNQTLIYVGSGITIIAALLIFGMAFQGMAVFCVSAYDYYRNYDTTNCRMTYMNCIILYVGFLIYLAIDNIYKIGNKRSIRIIITSGLLSIFAIMNGWTSLNQYAEIGFRSDDVGDADNASNLSDVRYPDHVIDPYINIWVGLYFYFMGSFCVLIFIGYCMRLCKVIVLKQLDIFMPYILIICAGYTFIAPIAWMNYLGTSIPFIPQPVYISYHSVYLYIPVLLVLIYDMNSAASNKQ